MCKVQCIFWSVKHSEITASSSVSGLGWPSLRQACPSSDRKDCAVAGEEALRPCSRGAQNQTYQFCNILWLFNCISQYLLCECLVSTVLKAHAVEIALENLEGRLGERFPAFN